MIKQYFVAVGLVALLAPSVHAAGDEQKAALAKSQYMLRQLTLEKSEIDKKNKELEESNKFLKSQVEKLQADVASKVSLLNQWQAKSQEQQEALVKNQQEYNLQQKELKHSVDLVGHQKSNIESRLQTQRENLSLCMINNHKLYDINQELVSSYQNKGFWAVIKHKEPFTGQKQVEVEKLVQEYQYRLDDAVVVEQGMD